MSRPPRSPQEAILSHRFLKAVFFYGLLITVSTMGAFLWALGSDPARASTVSFMTLALAQVFHLGNARSVRPVLRPARAIANRYALGAVALSVMLQLLTVSFEPVARVLRVVSLSAAEWAVVLAWAAMPAVVGQVLKLRATRSLGELSFSKL